LKKFYHTDVVSKGDKRFEVEVDASIKVNEDMSSVVITEEDYNAKWLDRIKERNDVIFGHKSSELFRNRSMLVL